MKIEWGEADIALRPILLFVVEIIARTEPQIAIDPRTLTLPHRQSRIPSIVIAQLAD
jgi:hypothetical protein